MFNFFAPKPGRFGVAPNLVTGVLPTAIPPSATTVFNLGGHPARSYVSRVHFSATTPPAGASAIAQVQKYNGLTLTAVPLTAPFDLATLTPHVGVVVPVIDAATLADRTLQPGDTLRLSVVAGAITTPDVETRANVELLVAE